MNSTHERSKPWPELRSAQEVACDGEHPNTDEPCVLGQHQGFHRDRYDTEWLDDGDLARPDWLDQVHDPRD